MSVVAAILDRAERTARDAGPDLRDHAAATILDCIMTAILGHTAPEVARIVAAQPGPGDASLLVLPARQVETGRAAYANALALCWYELDPGFRHAGCHVPLHILPSLLAQAEAHRLTISEVISHFIFCYEVVARLAMVWDTRPSGIHSHAIFSHLGAVAAVAATRDAGNDLVHRALDLGSSAVNVGNGWEVSHGGELRNLWPALAALHAGPLCDAAQAGITTAPERLERSFDRLFRRREEIEIESRFDGPALLEGYGKILPSCRHLHSAISAALAVSQEIGGDAERIEAVEVTAHAEAAALLTQTAPNLINAQFSLPICLAIALHEGRFDPTLVSASRDDEAVRALVPRIAVAAIHERGYPGDRAAAVTVLLSDGRRISKSVDTAEGDPADGSLQPAFLDKKTALVEEALPRALRDRFRSASAFLRGTFRSGDMPLGEALRSLS